MTFQSRILYIADVTGRDPTTLSYNNSGTDVEMSGANRVKHAVMLTDGASLPGSQIADLTAANRAFTVVGQSGKTRSTDRAIIIPAAPAKPHVHSNSSGIIGDPPDHSGAVTTSV